MTLEIAAVLFILAVALVLFVTEKLRMDVVAMLVLSALGVTKLVTLEGALAGFSNPAVVTVWSMFILSAGLSATGVADILGQQVLKIAGSTEPRMIFVIMMTTGILSAFMNNIGVAALMLPVVMDIARRTGTSPSRLLMPMAYSSLLGGLTTLVGTPPNLVASDALVQAGYEGFGLFSFTPIGLPALILGSLFVAFIGRHILPSKVPEGFAQSLENAGSEFRFEHALEHEEFRLRIAPDSPLAGKKLSESGLDAMLGLKVMAIERENAPNTIRGFVELEPDDVLLIRGRLDDFQEFQKWKVYEMATGAEIAELLSLNNLSLVSATVAEDSPLIGITIAESDFRQRFKAHILNVRRGDDVHRGNFPRMQIKSGDVFHIETLDTELANLRRSRDFAEVRELEEVDYDQTYRDNDALLQLDIPETSLITGLTVAESGIGQALRLRLIAIGRKQGPIFLPGGDEIFQPGDKLMAHGGKNAAFLIEGLQSLELVGNPSEGKEVNAQDAEQEDSEGFTEVTLAPQSSLIGKSLKELDFRHTIGLEVRSIWRGGRSFGTHLRNFELNLGDALVLSGPRDRMEALSRNKDFLVLTRAAYEDSAPSGKMALLATFIMLLVVGVVLSGYLPIAVVAVAGATLMIICRCLSIEDAYRAIEWKSVFLIACMIPLGSAMKDTGAAEWLAQGMAAVARPFGPWGMIIGLYLLTMLATTIVPTTALVLIMAHIGMDAADSLGMSPQMVVMAIALAASASFTSPISHPANVLVMGPGGYRFIDYMKMGIILAIMVMATVLPLLYFFLG